MLDVYTLRPLQYNLRTCAVSQIKCDQYWDDFEALEYGDMVVTLVAETKMPEYNIRLFTISLVSVNTYHHSRSTALWNMI